MNNNYKKLFEASEDAREKQDLIISAQNQYISELEDKNRSLSDALEQLSKDYDHSLSICQKQQEILDQIFEQHPEL